MKKLLSCFPVPFLVLILFLASFKVQAHEGHGDHGAAPMAEESVGPHGGVLKKALHHIMLELVKEGPKKVKIYPFDQAKKPLTVKEVEIAGKVEIPRKGTKDVSFEKKGDYLVADIDSQGAHRYVLKLEVVYKKHKHAVNFQVETDEGME